MFYVEHLLPTAHVLYSQSGMRGKITALLQVNVTYKSMNHNNVIRVCKTWCVMVKFVN